jgi:hypothetical protein
MIHFIIQIDNEVALVRAFLRIDSTGDGDIDEKEMKNALKDYLKLDCKTSEVAAKEIIGKIDLNHSGDISYSGTLSLSIEFVLGATDLRKVLTQENISKTFQYIDTDNSQQLSM